MKFRKATEKDLIKIVEMLADDEHGKKREVCQEPLPAGYLNAFKKINEDQNQELIVVEDDHLEIIGSMQLSYLHYLTYRGGLRVQVEAVRVRSDQRGKGIGSLMFHWAIKRAKERNAHLIQLTTDKERPAAFKFYKALGFIDSHEGMKLHL